MKNILAKLEEGMNEDHTSDSDDQSGPRKRQRTEKTKTKEDEAGQDGAGPIAAGEWDEPDVDGDTASESNFNPMSHCDEESDWDEDEERRKEILFSDTLALSIMKYAFTSGPGHLCA